MVWIGAGLTVLGIAGLVACVMMALGAKKQGLEDAALKARLKRVVVYNFAALMVSALGLMAVVAGIMLS